MRLGSDFDSGPFMTLNWLWRDFWHHFQQISSVRLSSHLLLTFHNFSLHILFSVSFHYSMSHSVAGSKIQQASSGLFSTPILFHRNTVLKASAFFFSGSQIASFYLQYPKWRMCFAIFTCGCLSTLNSLSVNLGNRERFHLQINLRMEDIHGSLRAKWQARSATFIRFAARVWPPVWKATLTFGCPNVW